MTDDNWLTPSQHKFIAMLIECGYKIEALKMYKTWAAADINEALIAVGAIHACYQFNTEGEKDD